MINRSKIVHGMAIYETAKTCKSRFLVCPVPELVREVSVEIYVVRVLSTGAAGLHVAAVTLLAGSEPVRVEGRHHQQVRRVQ